MQATDKQIPVEILQMMADARAETFDDAVAATIATLHRMIEDVERARFSGSHARTATERAGDIACALTWGLANCNVQLLMTTAVETDAARAAVAAADLFIA